MNLALLIIYGAALTFVFIYSLVQLNLVWNYIKAPKNKINLSSIDDNQWPKVTIQLPLFNEKYVVERLIQNIAKIKYPKGRLEIQVLDDSNDETTRIVEQCIKDLPNKNLFNLIRRPDRGGYKAGALRYGLEFAKGEFIAIFDADFLPQKDFLLKTIPYFSQHERIGVVQTKWGHINKDYNLLTKCQAFGLNAHFTVEQTGRNSANHFINFNGTGGVWRRKCIEDAGNWQADTLTEDLDLSYRAQLKGWKFKYLEEIESPAELPITMTALKSQQFRWTKGAAENTRKNLGKVFHHKLPLATKIHSLFHLMNSFIFICVLICSFLSVPILWVKVNYLEYNLLFKLSSVFILSLMILYAFYFTSYFRDHILNFKTLLRFTCAFPVFLALSMGLGIHNSIAVFEGLIGKKSPFVRTPKFNITAQNKNWKKNVYRMRSIGLLTTLEGLSSLYFLFGIALSIYLNDYSMIYLETLLFLGYFGVFYFSVKHALLDA